MIYISDANTEYLKYTMGEDKQDFIEVNRIEMARRSSENESLDADDIMTKMDNDKTLDLNLFSKLLHSTILSPGKHGDTIQMVANTWELIVLKIEFGKYYLFIYDTIKCLFKQKLEINLPASRCGS